MIISKKYAKQLETSGKARIERDESGNIVHTRIEGRPYALVTRLDVQRMDHYLDGTAGRDY